VRKGAERAQNGVKRRSTSAARRKKRRTSDAQVAHNGAEGVREEKKTGENPQKSAKTVMGAINAGYDYLHNYSHMKIPRRSSRSERGNPVKGGRKP